MNFYQHHIGDFNNATRHLSRIERSIYRDLLELYYDTESPLTSDFDRLARRCIVDDCDRAAMREVLNEFFTLADDGYHNTRADREIAAYKRMAEGGKRGAEKRWGKCDDSPPITTPLPPHAEANANHEPRTSNQEPLTKNHTKEKARTSALACPQEIDPQIWDDWLSLRKAKRAPVTETVLNAAKTEAQKAGMTLEAFLQEWVSRGSQGLKAEWIQSQSRGGAPPKSRHDLFMQKLKSSGEQGEQKNERDITGVAVRVG